MKTLRRQIGDWHWGIRRVVRESWPVRAWGVVFNPLWLARLRLRQVVVGNANLARGRLLDVGCGSKPYEKLFKDVTEYVGLEMEARAGVDVVGDARALPFGDETFDTVLCCQVLEHVPDPRKVLEECGRVLKDGGVLLLTTPQVWGLHLEPHDYFRYTRHGLAHLAEGAGLEVEKVEPTCGVFATLAQRLADTLTHGVIGRGSPLEWVRGILSVMVSPVLAAGFLADSVVGKRGDTLDNLLVARKAIKKDMKVGNEERVYAKAA